MVGGFVSTTIIFCIILTEFVATSVAVQIIVVVPNGNCAGALLDSDLIPLASVAIACPTETGVRPPVASINKSFGGVMTGFVRSPGTGFSVWVCCAEVVFSVEEYV